MERLFRLSIWRPAKLPRPIDYFSPPSASEEGGKAFCLDGIYEQVYAWDPGLDDPFLSLEKETARKFRDLLFVEFAPNRPPERRSLTHLAEKLEDIKRNIYESESSFWVPSTQKVDNESGDDINLRLNAARALIIHLEWLIKTFEHLPGACVVIR